jgi:hypothetical protein
MIGIVLVTDPFRSFNIETMPEGESSSMNETDPHLPNTLLSKFIGVLCCIPSMFGQAAECKYLKIPFAVFLSPVVSMRQVGDQATAAQMMVYLGFCPVFVAAG